jgi:hypothetical protein
MAILKLDKGMVKKLSKEGKLSPEFSKNLTGEELTLEIKNSELFIDTEREDKLLEISDVNNSFALWFKPDSEEKKKLRKYLGP